MSEDYPTRVLRVIRERQELVMGEDGFYYFWPSAAGALSAVDLAIIMGELNRLNEPIQTELENYFASH